MTDPRIPDVSSWNPVRAEGTFYLGQPDSKAQCVVPLATLIDRFPPSPSSEAEIFQTNLQSLGSVAQILIDQGCGHGGRLVIRGIDFLGRMSSRPVVSPQH